MEVLRKLPNEIMKARVLNQKCSVTHLEGLQYDSLSEGWGGREGGISGDHIETGQSNIIFKQPEKIQQR